MESSKLETLRHSCAHLLAAAVKKLYPEAKFTIGPSIENGFYYDFDLPEPFTPEDLEKIEAKMHELSEKDLKFEKSELPIKEAIKEMEKINQPYKVELLKDLGEDKASFYKTGDFFDPCRGPHVKSTKEIKYFKLLKTAGAYWRGNEKNKMLQRVYGTCFETEKELDEYLAQLEEAKKNDHRKLGKDLDLFVFSDLVGPGLPLFTPKGTLIKELLQQKVEEICKRFGFKKVLTPHIAKIELYKTSGHAEKFGDELFHVTSKNKQNFVMRPVLCPHQTQIYASKTRSYKELPIRYMESEKMYRAEKPGEIGGLNRVYAITVEDGHCFCRVDQVKQEIKNMVEIVKIFYSEIGMWGNHWVSLSVRDYSNPQKYIGEPKDWDECEKILQEVSDEMDLKAQRREGEAALYGPKLDFMFKDAMGREIQIPTVQVDFATPKRFKLVFINKEGKEESPVMVHRAILGSYERFIALLLEHFGGAFPVWLAPVQVIILPVSDKHLEYAQKVAEELKDWRLEIDERNESVGKKIRDAELQKIPYIIVVGDKEIKDKNITVRERGSKELETLAVGEFIQKIKS